MQEGEGEQATQRGGTNKNWEKGDEVSGVAQPHLRGTTDHNGDGGRKEKGDDAVSEREETR